MDWIVQCEQSSPFPFEHHYHSVLILICGVNVLMTVTQERGGIDLLADLLASLMNESTACPIMGLTGGLMSWFSSANGVVCPTLVPAAPQIAANVGNVNPVEMIAAIVGGASVAGVSPMSTGGTNPVHLSVDRTNRWIFVANLQTGTVAVIPRNEDGSLGEWYRDDAGWQAYCGLESQA